MLTNTLLIGRRVKEFRRRAHFTQEKLAEYTDLSVQHIGNIEKGRKQASLSSFIRIADALGITTDLLLLGNCDNEITVHVCEFAELIIGCSNPERDAILDAAIVMSKALRDKK